MLTLAQHMELVKFVLTHDGPLTIHQLRRRFPCHHATAWKWMKHLEAAGLVRHCPDERRDIYRRNFHLTQVPSLIPNQVRAMDPSIVPPTHQN